MVGSRDHMPELFLVSSPVSCAVSPIDYFAVSPPVYFLVSSPVYCAVSPPVYCAVSNLFIVRCPPYLLCGVPPVRYLTLISA